MAVRLNHTIVNVRSKEESAKFFTEVFGLPDAVPFAGFFLGVKLGGVTLDFCTADYKPEPQHYAFLQGHVNRYFGGRGVYFEEPSGHFLEIITKPYGKREDA